MEQLTEVAKALHSQWLAWCKRGLHLLLATLERDLGGKVVFYEGFQYREGKEYVGAVFLRAVIPKFEYEGA